MIYNRQKVIEYLIKVIEKYDNENYGIKNGLIDFNNIDFDIDYNSRLNGDAHSCSIEVIVSAKNGFTISGLVGCGFDGGDEYEDFDIYPVIYKAYVDFDGNVYNNFGPKIDLNTLPMDLINFLYKTIIKDSEDIFNDDVKKYLHDKSLISTYYIPENYYSVAVKSYIQTIPINVDLKDLLRETIYDDKGSDIDGLGVNPY